MKVYDVVLPEPVIRIIRAARGEDPTLPLEDVLGDILAALPYIAAALHAQMTEQEYRYFREIVKLRSADARTVMDAKDPTVALQQQVADRRKRLGADARSPDPDAWWRS